MVAVKGRLTVPVCLTTTTAISNMGGTELGSLTTSLWRLPLSASLSVVKLNLFSSSCLSGQHQQLYFTNNHILSLHLKSLQNSILCPSASISIEVLGTSSKVKVEA